MRPLTGFHQVGIDVFYCGMTQSVEEAVTAYLQGPLPAFGEPNTCGGDPNHAHPR